MLYLFEKFVPSIRIFKQNGIGFLIMQFGCPGYEYQSVCAIQRRSSMIRLQVIAIVACSYLPPT